MGQGIRGVRVLALVWLLSVACAPSSHVVALRVRAMPLPTPTAGRTEVLAHLETPRPTPTARAWVEPRATTPAPAVDRFAAFRGLGSWSDVYDYTDDPSTIVPLVRELAGKGVRTLYVQTGRYASPGDIQSPHAVGSALDEAKAHGMRVVAWYAPDFSNLALDLRRSVAAIDFRSPRGNRFDAFGADIEYSRVKNMAERNRRVVEYCRRLRVASRDVPLAAIVFPPTQLEKRPDIWPGYPWAEFGRDFDVVMAMNYWTFHTKDPKQVAQSTENNAVLVRKLTGRPAHVIGGLAGDADLAQTVAYVTAAVESGSIGGGLYDGRTTSAAQWRALAMLNR